MVFAEKFKGTSQMAAWKLVQMCIGKKILENLRQSEVAPVMIPGAI